VSSASELAEARQETRESWSAALRMIRETVETLGAPGIALTRRRARALRPGARARRNRDRRGPSKAAGALMAKVPPAGRAMVRFIARTLHGVKTAPFPGFIEPCKPTLRPKPPAATNGNTKSSSMATAHSYTCAAARRPCSRAADWIGRISSRRSPKRQNRFQ
jgi:hypothetical protein